MTMRPRIKTNLALVVAFWFICNSAAADTSKLEQALLNKISNAQAQLNQTQAQIAKQRGQLTKKLVSLEHELVALEKKAVSARKNCR